MSIQSQSTFRFRRCARATRPMRRLLLLGLPLVLMTRCFGIGDGSVSAVNAVVRNNVVPLVRRRASDKSHDRSEEHTSELQSQSNLVCRLLLEKKKYQTTKSRYARRGSAYRGCRVSPRYSRFYPPTPARVNSTSGTSTLTPPPMQLSWSARASG